LSSAGISLGPPLNEFSGIFSGNPQFVGKDIPAVDRTDGC
jgi:circadian clock protein KaiC